MYEIEFYQDSHGNEPIAEYIAKLAKQANTNKDARIRFAKITAYIDHLKQYGTRIGAPVTKHIEGAVWELRPLDDRIFYFFWKDNTFVLLHQFVKKTQKTPRSEIEQAKRNMADYLERNDD